MTTTSPVQLVSAAQSPLPAAVLYILRIEGLAVAVITALLYARTGASWWLFAALWLAPDLSMLGYLGRPCRASRIYNAAHTYTLPITLAASGLLLHGQVLLPFALIWANHIGVDRMLAYGLKFQEGFGWTHLSRPRKNRERVTQPA